MAFQAQRMIRFSGGGDGNNSIWLYVGTADNLASVANATVNTSCFQQAYSTHGIKALAGDVIIATYVAASMATGVVMVVPSNWDSNGASVMAIAQVKS